MTSSSNLAEVPKVLMAPTVSAPGELPGEVTPPKTLVPSFALPKFPAEHTTTMPAATARSTACATGEVRNDSGREPNDRFTTRIPKFSLLAIANSSASMTALAYPHPSLFMTRRSRMWAFGARRATMPATCVPWPWPSFALPSSSAKLRLTTTRFPRSGCSA